MEAVKKQKILRNSSLVVQDWVEVLEFVGPILTKLSRIFCMTLMSHSSLDSENSKVHD